MEAVAGASATVATGAGGGGGGGAVTVTAEVPERPSLVAVIVTGPPAATPLTRPVFETEATPGLLELQLIDRPVNRLPDASRRVAASCRVCPVEMLPVAGATTTVATGAGGGGGAAVTVSDALPLTPSEEATRSAVPALMPVAQPFASTCA